MKRREFVTSSLAASAMAGLGSTGEAAGGSGGGDPAPEYYQLMVWRLRRGPQAKLTKIKMFNEGEIAIFRRTGLRPVFFGETLIGSRLPNLTYMLTFDSIEQRDRNWSAFVADPEWKKLSATPGYTDAETVSNISNVLLSPAPYSQI